MPSQTSPTASAHAIYQGLQETNQRLTALRRALFGDEEECAQGPTGTADCSPQMFPMQQTLERADFLMRRANEQLDAIQARL